MFVAEKKHQPKTSARTSAQMWCTMSMYNAIFWKEKIKGNLHVSYASYLETKLVNSQHLGNNIHEN